MRVLIIPINHQFSPHRLAPLVLGQHAEHCLAHHVFRLSLEQLLRTDLNQPAGINRMMAVHLLRQLVAREAHPGRIDYNDVIPEIQERSKFHLMLASQQSGHLRSQPA